MKKITISLFTLFTLISFGQEKEIKEAFNAYESGNKSQAQTLIQQVESVVNEKSSVIEPDAYAKYLYVKGNSLLEQGKTLEAAKAFSVLSAYENGPVYSLKNKETKEKAFVLSKSEAEKLQTQGFSGLKETKSGTAYIQKVLPVLDQKRQVAAAKASEEYGAKSYAKAAENFLESHYLTKAAGVNDDIFKYYAALSFHAGKNDAKALDLYKELINDGYTGVKTLYTAVDSNKQKVNLSESDFLLLQKATNSGYTNFKKEETPSVEAELYKYAITILSADKKNDEALALVEKGLSKQPNDKDLNILLGELYYQTGQTDKYITKLKEAIQKDPNDYLAYYNLGVIYSKDPKTYDLAKENYDKAISIKPDYSAAYLNMASLILSTDNELVEKMKAVGVTKEDKVKYEALVAERRTMFRKALPYLEKAYENDKKDIGVIRALKEAYRVLKIEEKMEAMKQAEKAL